VKKESYAALVRRTFDAPREEVFANFTDPGALKRWWIAFEGGSVIDARVDLRVGGAWRLVMRDPYGTVTSLGGTYREVRVPEKLVYTWRWEGDIDVGESLVTVEFRALRSSTEMVIVQELLPSEHQVQFHTWGWNQVLDRLAKLLMR